MVAFLIFIVLLAIVVGIGIAFATEDEGLIPPIATSSFVLILNVIIFIHYVIPDCKNQAIKDYISGKYKKEITYKMVQKDSLMVPIDSTIVYKPIKD